MCTVLPKRHVASRELLSSAESGSARSLKKQRGSTGILSSKILIDSTDPLKELSARNKERKQMVGRFSMASGRRRCPLQVRSILKSSTSNMRGGTPGRSKRAKRAVSFSNNLEKVHFFDPNQTFKRGINRLGNSLDFRINITAHRRSTSNTYSGTQGGKTQHPQKVVQLQQPILGRVSTQ